MGIKTIDRVLSTGDAFLIDPSACMEQANILRHYKPISETTPWSNRPKSTQLLFKVAFIAICHQINWDFLQRALFTQLLVPKGRDLVDQLRNTRSTDIEQWLSEYPRKDRIRAKERARLIRDVGQTIEKHFNANAQSFYKVCAGSSLGDGAFHRVLDLFEAFRSDLLKKKTNVLTHDLFREHILRFRDPENIEPAIDYHIMRVYLRTGRVVPTDPAVLPFLKRAAPRARGALVRALRKTVADAEKTTAAYAGLSIPELNYIEWQVGRGICFNKGPQCRNSGPDVALDIRALNPSGCPFSRGCMSLNYMQTFMELEEPNYVSKHF